MYKDDIYCYYIKYQLVFRPISHYLLKHNHIREETQFESIYKLVALLIRYTVYHLFLKIAYFHVSVNDDLSMHVIYHFSAILFKFEIELCRHKKVFLFTLFIV